MPQHKWKPEEDEICCQKYYEYCVKAKEIFSPEDLLEKIKTAFKKIGLGEIDDNSIKNKLKNIKYILSMLEIKDTLDILPLPNYSDQNWKMMLKVISENKTINQEKNFIFDNTVYKEYKFTQIVMKILKLLGYDILPTENSSDITIKKDDKKYIIVCKLSATDILSYMKNNKLKSEFLYIVPFKEDVANKLIGAWYCEKDFPLYDTWDISDLQRMLTEHCKNKQKTKKILDELSDFTNQYYNLNLINNLDKDIIQKTYDKYQNSKPTLKWRNFEKFMVKFVEFYFQGYIGHITTQQNTDNCLHRFDAIAPIITRETNSYFLEIVRNCFNCRYLLFEAKSYKNNITQDEIWRTSKYLHKSALRSVAIIITNSKCNKNCRAIQYGLLREQGKLIVVLEGKDIERIIFANKNIIDIVLKEKVDDLMTTLNA